MPCALAAPIFRHLPAALGLFCRVSAHPPFMAASEHARQGRTSTSQHTDITSISAIRPQRAVNTDLSHPPPPRGGTRIASFLVTWLARQPAFRGESTQAHSGPNRKGLRERREFTSTIRPDDPDIGQAGSSFCGRRVHSPWTTPPCVQSALTPSPATTTTDRFEAGPARAPGGAIEPPLPGGVIGIIDGHKSKAPRRRQ